MTPNKLTPGYNLMWESSRMMLPEHREQLLEERRRQKEFRSPLLDEDQLQKINRVIAESIEQERAVTVTYAEKYGPVQFWGWVKHVKPHEKWLKLINDEDTLTISFDRILDVEMS
ncbi:YolD-like family protein [Fictibacillus gelatini]|uniref:YolD-like family protein n=1 Tax=Fictibacillus gelatini TaxID=225985 RepID=UPI0004790524|nr:YolD-like family protein [Fictibacillus gelatini]